MKVHGTETGSVVFDGVLSCGGLVPASTAVAKYVYETPQLTVVSVNVSEPPATELIFTAAAPFVER